MALFCTDADILRYEPVLFGELHLPWQVRACGDGGRVEDGFFEAEGADFLSAGVGQGSVIYLRGDQGCVEGGYAVRSVESADRLELCDEGAVLPDWQGLSYRVSSYRPQIEQAGYELTLFFGLRPGAGGSRYGVEHLVDVSVLTRATVFAVAASVYAMGAGQHSSELFWSKSLHYRQAFERARRSIVVGIDVDGDGRAEVFRDGGVGQLVRS